MFSRRAKAVPGPVHLALGTHVRQIVANLILSDTGQVWAGYRIGAARWNFTSDAHREQLLASVADVWAAVAGREVQERVTTRPHPVAAWAQALSQRTPHPLDERLYGEHLRAMQRRIASAGMDDKIIYRYLSVGRLDPRIDLRAQMLSDAMASAEVRKVLAEEKRIADAVTGPGWHAVRMSEQEQGWLRERSLAPSMPAPLRASGDGWDTQDLPQLSNDVRWLEQPFDRTVEVHGWRGGQESVLHAQVLTAARMSDLHYPQNGLEPWQAYAERALDADGRPFGVEWNLTGRIATGAELMARAELDLNKALNIQESYKVFDEIPPEYTGRGIEVALEARDQIGNGQARESSRFDGTISVVVTGAAVVDERGRVIKSAADVCEERADAFTRLYAGNALRMEFTAPPAQSARLRELVPGEGFDHKGYQRQVRLSYLAAGLPNVSTTVGDRRGPYIGYTLGAARRPVFHDSHYATEGQGHLGRKQNMYLVVGSLGSGKSVLLNLLTYENVLRGTRVVVRDPSGPMMALCAMPELAAVSRPMNLLQGERGILSPPTLVREPQRGEYEPGEAGDEAFTEALMASWSERSALTQDIARRTLPPDLYDNGEARAILRSAAAPVRWDTSASLWNLIYEMEKMGDVGSLPRQMAYALRDASTMPMLSLMFPRPADAGDFADPHSNALLTVISTPGIRRASDGTPRVDWSPQELAADPLLRLTTLFTDRELFGKPREQRAVAIFDEAEDMTDSGAGRGQLARLGRDHSKWNIAVYLALKNMTTEMMGGEMRNFLAGAWVGQMANREPAEALLSVLHIEDKAYAQVLMGLSTTSPGQFVHLDADGRVGGMKVDIDHLPELKRIALTNPTPDGAEAWAYTEGALV